MRRYYLSVLNTDLYSYALNLFRKTNKSMKLADKFVYDRSNEVRKDSNPLTINCLFDAYSIKRAVIEAVTAEKLATQKISNIAHTLLLVTGIDDHLPRNLISSTLLFK